MNIFDYFKARSERDLAYKASWMFQIREHNSELWLTYGVNGALICPCSMLKGEPVEAVKQMRELYIKSKE